MTDNGGILLIIVVGIYTAGQKHRICVSLISTRNQELELSVVWCLARFVWMLVDHTGSKIHTIAT